MKGEVCRWKDGGQGLYTESTIHYRGVRLSGCGSRKSPRELMSECLNAVEPDDFVPWVIANFAEGRDALPTQCTDRVGTAPSPKVLVIIRHSRNMD